MTNNKPLSKRQIKKLVKHLAASLLFNFETGRIYNLDEFEEEELNKAIQEFIEKQVPDFENLGTVEDLVDLIKTR